MNLPKLQQDILISKDEDGQFCISKYQGGELTPKAGADCVAKIKRSFPMLTNGFFDVFLDRCKDNGFNDERLIAAVNYVIDNCQYPTPTIANFISFDKKVKLFDYNQACDYVSRYGGDFDKWFETIEVNGKKWKILK